MEIRLFLINFGGIKLSIASKLLCSDVRACIEKRLLCKQSS